MGSNVKKITKCDQPHGVDAVYILAAKPAGSGLSYTYIYKAVLLIYTPHCSFIGLPSVLLTL